LSAEGAKIARRRGGGAFLILDLKQVNFGHLVQTIEKNVMMERRLTRYGHNTSVFQ